MNIYLLIPLVSTLAGYAAGLIFRALALRRLPVMLQRSRKELSSLLFSSSGVRAVLSSSASFESIRPLIEGHVDQFLGHKLGKEMPMIGMFIGDKTIAQLKAIFMKELEEIFPPVMDKYVSDLSAGIDPSALMLEKMPAMTGFLRKRLTLIPLYGAVAGLITGALQIIIIFFAA